MIQEFKQFILRGNVMDLAVAVVIGAAFKTVIDGFVQFILMPIIGILGGKPSFDEYTLTINDSVIRWGSFLTVLVQFLSVAAAVFVAVRAYDSLRARRKQGEEEEQGDPSTDELLTQIRDLLAAK